MIPDQFSYQLVVLGLLWLFVMLHCAWPSRGVTTQTQPSTPIIPRRKRSNDAKPFTGLTQKPYCALCAHEATHPPVRPAPPQQLPPTNRQPREVDTSRHFCPHAHCASRGWLGLGNLRANGHPSGGLWRQCHCTACDGYFPEHYGTIFHGKRVAVELIVRVLACWAEDFLPFVNPNLANFLPHLHDRFTTNPACSIARTMTQHSQQDTQASVAKMASGLAMPLPLRPHSRRPAAAGRIALPGDSRQGRQRMAHAGVPTVPHHPLSALATLRRSGGDPAMRAQHLRVSFGQGLGGFRKKPGRDFPSDPGQRLPQRDIRWTLPLARLVSHGAQQGASLVAPGLTVLGQDSQTGQQETTRGLRGFCGARGPWQRPRLSARPHLWGLDAAAALRLEPMLDLRRAQPHGVGGGGGPSDPVPQPGRIGRRAPLEHRGSKPGPRLPEPSGTPTERCAHRFFRSPALSLQSPWRCIQLEPTTTGPIGTACVGQDTGRAPVRLGSRDTVTSTAPGTLRGGHRKDVDASFDQPCDHRATRPFDGHGSPRRLSRRHGPPPGRQLGQPGASMVHGPCTHQATVAVEHTDLRRR
jgi:hypothetical protein